MNIVYTYNGVDLKTYGVSVSKGRGFLGDPERKDPKKYEYPDENGYIPDLVDPVYKERTITLECYIVADNPVQLATKHKTFTRAMTGVTGLVPFTVTINGTQVFSGSVYADKVSDINKTFSDGKNVGTFNLTIVEPNPTIS